MTFRDWTASNLNKCRLHSPIYLAASVIGVFIAVVFQHGLKSLGGIPLDRVCYGNIAYSVFLGTLGIAHSSRDMILVHIQ